MFEIIPVTSRAINDKSCHFWQLFLVDLRGVEPLSENRRT